MSCWERCSPKDHASASARSRIAISSILDCLACRGAVRRSPHLSRQDTHPIPADLLGCDLPHLLQRFLQCLGLRFPAKIPWGVASVWSVLLDFASRWKLWPFGLGLAQQSSPPCPSKPACGDATKTQALAHWGERATHLHPPPTEGGGPCFSTSPLPTPSRFSSASVANGEPQQHVS